MRLMKTAEGTGQSSHLSFCIEFTEGTLSTVQNKQKKTITEVQQKNNSFDLYICSCLVIVDVSYTSVLGDIVWTGDGLGSECILSASLVSYGVFLQCLYCIAILVGLYYTSRGFRKGDKSGLGGVILERGGRFCKCVKMKNTPKKKKKTAFYILPVVNIRVLNLVLAGLL